MPDTTTCHLQFVTLDSNGREVLISEGSVHNARVPDTNDSVQLDGKEYDVERIIKVYKHAGKGSGRSLHFSYKAIIRVRDKSFGVV